MALYQQYKEVRRTAHSPLEESEMVGHVVGKTLIATIATVALGVAVVVLVPDSKPWAGPLIIGCAMLGIVVGGMWGMRTVVRKYTRVGITTTA